MKEVTVKIDKDKLDEVKKMIGEAGLPKFFKAVRDNVAHYIPQDTQTLIGSYFVEMSEDGLSGALCYGSRIDDDPLNVIAVRQHEAMLNHYGLPGRSMREGIQGANIPGSKYAIHGKSLNISASPTLRRQRLHYAVGYREKRAMGDLAKYATKFLEKAVEETVGQGVDFKDVLQRKVDNDGI